MCNVRGNVAIITETKSTYVMIKSTLQFDDIEVIPGLLPLLRVVQRSHMWSRERSRRRPVNEATQAYLPDPLSDFSEGLVPRLHSQGVKGFGQIP